jgi:hypothetical protein
MTDPAIIAALLNDLESFRVERTESLRDSDKFCKAICAFANDMAGVNLPASLVESLVFDYPRSRCMS